MTEFQSTGKSAGAMPNRASLPPLFSRAIIWRIIWRIIGQGNDIARRRADIFGKAAGAVHAHAQRVAAQMAPARPAIAAMATGHVAFTRDTLADVIIGDGCAHIDHLAHEFMAYDHGHGHGFGRPFIPVPDMHIGAADRRFAPPDRHVSRPGLWRQNALHPQAFAGVGLDQRLHHIVHQITPNSRPTAAKALIASSS